MVVKFTVPKRIWSEVSPKTLQRARSHSSCILSFNLIGQHQNKRFCVTENRFAARVRRRYFSEGEKRRPEMRLLFAC